ncbi:iron-sulfur cluster carrier protein ApbC [Azospirillum sp. B4]|uniref:iron-sulfur cluster carrier protein ApbC n=1 Tax=Azospirillum sp. B4 TaxID=95605 RepID=UPI0007E8C0ED|nr:iron-sulfur cluster carrier protein ApbC [Azospirillum sp. B4]
MMAVTESQVLEALRRVVDPDRGSDIVSLKMVSGVAVKDGHVHFTLEVDPQRGAALEPLRQSAEKAVDRLPGVLSVTAVLTAHRPAPKAVSGGPGAPAAPGAAPGAKPAKAGIPGVAAIIAVASGKGGVGKSTTSTNLALAMAANGLKVGLLDADIYGPSMPRMMGLSGKPDSTDGKRLDPLVNYGIKVMSMGFLVAEDTPMIWRGPMVMSAITQMLRDVNWGELDVLVVDMPPGTGDAQLTMAQGVPLAGAVIVSTPQDIALLDARKGLNMFRRVDVPVLGIIENMSYFCCPNCGHRSDIFSHGGAKAEAEKLGIDFLGEVPLDIAIRETSDAGTPITVSQPDGVHAQTYRAIAARVAEKIKAGGGRAAPRFVIE